MKDKMKAAINLDPVVKPKKLFEEIVDSIRDGLGRHQLLNLLKIY